MNGIRTGCSFKPAYQNTGAFILNDFLLPALKHAVRYDRITGYFTTEALLATAQGLESLYQNGGEVRLAIGIHSFPSDLAKAVAKRETFAHRIKSLRNEFREGITHLSDALQKDSLATLALLIESGRLTVKAVDTIEQGAIFHSKMIIVEDENEDSVAAIGSLNETASGLGGNVENLVVLRSWVDPEAVSIQKDIFIKTWCGKYDYVITQELTKELAEDIINGLGTDYIDAVRMRLSSSSPLSAALKMPEYYFVSGAIPALYQHQERAVLDALSRWPVRVLFADEVGLGKTFEVASTVAFLLRFCGAKRAVILTPKSVLQQWQDELWEHFGIEAWLFNSSGHYFVNPKGKTIHTNRKNPMDKDAPAVTLFSAQFVRGNKSRLSALCESDTALPDILVLDEAHAARVSSDLAGDEKSTKLYNVLMEVSKKIPHLILATATPMQKDASEYHSLLKLLGLPHLWSKSKAYDLALSVVGNNGDPTLSAANSAARLLLESVRELKPSTDTLNEKERTLLLNLTQEKDSILLGKIALDSWSDFRSLFIKMHPARLLTVRNTRSSLERIGYSFPKRNLKAIALEGYTKISQFYRHIESYINGSYLSADRALRPDKKYNDGFVKIGYQQRMASSLHSCLRSLERRCDSLNRLRRAIAGGAALEPLPNTFDDTDLDEALMKNIDFPDSEIESSILDISQIRHQADIELADITSLLATLKEILAECGDPKVDASISHAMKYLAQGDSVLLFSRYTDTVDALIERWRNYGISDIMYGKYTGDEATISLHGRTQQATKSEIKVLLNRGQLKVLFCSDAASEGLNLQAARVLINVDVPWTPARLEQRIGRVARLGQRAKEVDILNVWYPNSIEAQMYDRLSKRLEKYNLAVGEFPEVVADSIRDSLLNGDVEDNSTELLRTIYGTIQTKALQMLWERNGSEQTSSHKFRKELLAALKMKYPCAEYSSSTKTTFNTVGRTIDLTEMEGDDSTVSLSTGLIADTFSSVEGHDISYDEDGQPCAYSHNGQPLRPEYLTYALSGEYGELEYSSAAPKWLPDNNSLNLEYACENTPPRPKLWPPTRKEN